MPIQNLFGVLKAILPEGNFSTNNEGELIVYTNLYSNDSLDTPWDERTWEPKADCSPEYLDVAIHILAPDVEPGGEFFMNESAVVGWWCVRSQDPAKQDLFIPAHIFNKCFQVLAGHGDEGWVVVHETD